MSNHFCVLGADLSHVLHTSGHCQDSLGSFVMVPAAGSVEPCSYGFWQGFVCHLNACKALQAWFVCRDADGTVHLCGQLHWLPGFHGGLLMVHYYILRAAKNSCRQATCKEM